MTLKFTTRTLKIILISIFSLGTFQLKAQHVIDQILAVVGAEKILLSDIEQEFLRMRMSGIDTETDFKCEIFEEQLIHKLLVNQAAIDSIEVDPGTVDSEMERNLRYFINQVGSEAELEKYFNKPMFRIRADLRKSMREGLTSKEMQETIVKNVTVTPSEIKSYYRKIPKDSIPIIPERYEIRQIVLYPGTSNEAKLEIKEQLLDIRERVLKGERFATLAVAYSQDRATASRGGELGFQSREELVKSFADVAFNLKDGQVSQIVETEYGFHLIQMIERKQDRVNVRHILMKPTFSMEQLLQSTQKLDSIVTLVKTDSLTFSQAAIRFSDDKTTRTNGGLLINPHGNTNLFNSSLFEKEHLPPADFYVIKDLKEGEISAPFESRDEHANVVNKVVMINRIIPSHTANLDLDYETIQKMALMEKKQKVFEEWIQKMVKTTFIRIDPSYQNCQFQYEGWLH